MQKAIDLAIVNVEKGLGGPFGAVIVKDNKIIAEGSNLVTSSQDPTAHAEIMAIRRACAHLNNFQLNDCELYTSCEPCPMCLGAIYWARPAKVFFGASQEQASDAGFDDSYIYKEIAKSFSKREIFMQQIMPNQANLPFEKWLKAENKIKY